jgi:hypothetical protein
MQEGAGLGSGSRTADFLFEARGFESGHGGGEAQSSKDDASLLRPYLGLLSGDIRRGPSDTLGARGMTPPPARPSCAPDCHAS